MNASSGWLRTPRLWVLLVWCLAMAAGIAVVSRTHFTADLSAFLPNSPDARQKLLIEQLQSGIASRTLLIGITGGDGAGDRATASSALAAALRASGRFEQVQNGDTHGWRETGAWLVAHRYQLSPAMKPAHFTLEGLRAAVDDTLSLLGTPAGAAVRPLLERDPTGEVQRIAESLVPASAPRSEAGVWVSRNAPRAVLIATTRAAGANLDAQAADIAVVRSAFAINEVQGLQLEISGPAVFAVQSRDRIQREAGELALLGVLAMSGLLLLAFASPRALLLAFLPVATGVVGGTCAVALVFGTVHGLTLGFGSTLIGETVDYALYYLIQARLTGAMEWKRQHWPTVRLGLMTSVAGFTALIFSGFPGLAQLGVFSVAGLLAAALATRYVLPVLAPHGAEGQGLRRHLSAAAGTLVRAMPRLRIVLLFAGVLAAGLLLREGGGLWDASLASMSPIPRGAQLLDAALRNDLGASDARTLVVVQAADEEATLRAAEAAGARLEALMDKGRLAGFDSPARFLPSQAVQEARKASIPDAPLLRARLARALAGGPLPAARLDAFLDEVEAARTQAPLRRADLNGTALAPLVDALLVARPEGGFSALLPLQSTGSAIDAEELRAVLRDEPAAVVVDVKRELDSLYERYLREALVQVTLGAVAVVLLLGLHLRRAARLAAVCLPLALAVLLTLGGWAAGHAFAGWPALGILHLVGLLLMVAVGSNYALFFDQISRTGAADPDTLTSLLLANLTTVLSFGLIALSDIPALSAIGRVVAPGALLALLISAAFSARFPMRTAADRVE